MRKIFFWMHLGAGLLASTLILFFSITGALLAYERQIIHAADTRSYKPTQSPGLALPLDQLLAHAAVVIPAPLESVTIHPDPRAPLELATARRDIFFVDPRSAAVQGPMSPRTRALFSEVTALHRWFGLGNASHDSVLAIKGATILLFLFLLVSGASLWLPRTYSWSALRVGVIPRFNTQGRARNYNWHKVAGLWTGPPLLVIALTGTIMAYPWANASLFRAAGTPVPVRGGRRPGPSPQKHPLPAHLDQALALAITNAGSWQSITLPLALEAHQLRITIDNGDGGQPQKREQLFFDLATRTLTKREPFASLPRGQQWRSWVRFLHTGEAGGAWGETLALVAALGAIVLSLTGILLSYHRFRRQYVADLRTNDRPVPASINASTAVRE